MKLRKYILWLIIFTAGCAGLKSHVDFYYNVEADLKTGNYLRAGDLVDKAKSTQKYSKKDRALYYLDKGVILHYAGKYSQSNVILEDADQAMEELYTKSISRAAASLLLNDNILEYSGEIYDNIYVNIFKALNYLHLKKFDGALVEVNRINDKLRVLDDLHSEWVEQINSSDSAKIKIERKSNEFYDDVLANYLSYLIYRVDGAYDDSRISYERLVNTWNSYSEIYNFPFPQHLDSVSYYRQEHVVNIMAFAGNGPDKYEVGGQITTYDDVIHVSDLTYFKENHIFAWPGIKQGYHFKFAFPDMRQRRSNIDKVIIRDNGKIIGELELLENMGNVSLNTFESNKHVIYFKTLIRTIIKGLASEKGKKKLREKANAEDSFLLGAILNWTVDMAVDATENPDLRCWRTLPQNCYVGEFALESGKHNINVEFLSSSGSVVKKEKFRNFNVSPRFNLIEAICLN
ncbi:MAG: hypothetical protein KAS18_10255 [Calditrichia bacterium]|nr:hypothetical protein [Calditrichia bacterium]